MVTWIMIKNEDLAVRYSRWLYQRSEVEKPDNKGTAHLCIYDLIQQYGRERVDKWTKRQWIGVMMELLVKISAEAEQETYHLRCCEATCKYFLMEKDADPPEELLSLLQCLCMAYFYPKYRQFKRMREMVKQFIVIYIQQNRDSLSRWYFACMSAIKRFCSNYKNGEEDVQLADIERVVQASVHWCTSDVLHQEGEKTELDAGVLGFDPNFMTLLYYSNMITEFSDDEYIVEIFTRTMDFADVTKIDRVSRDKLHQPISKAHKLLNRSYGARSEFTKRTDRILNALKQLKHIDMENDQKQQKEAAAAGPSQETAPPKRGRGRGRQLPVTRIKKNVTGSSQMYTAQNRALPENPFSDVIPLAPAEERARALPRASKQRPRKLFMDEQQV